MSNSIYCPICGRWIEPINEEEVLNFEHDGYIYVHDEIDHSEEDMIALGGGMN